MATDPGTIPTQSVIIRRVERDSKINFSLKLHFANSFQVLSWHLRDWWVEQNSYTLALVLLS